jgi:uncharacterized protein
VVVAGSPVLEPTSPVVWFTFPGQWHDIGRFHLPDGTFTGYYANVLTPVRLDSDDWRTTDLFLDVFVTPAGGIHLLDADELAAAEERGWLDAQLALRARLEAERLIHSATAGTWPPPVVDEWTLARAEHVASGTPAPPPVYRVRPDRESADGR